jgi:uncharacterized protein DUF6152
MWLATTNDRRSLVKDKLLMVFAVAIGVLIVSVPLFAHHGTAALDTDKNLTMKGTVTEWFWANPHCFIQMDVKDDQGQMVHWVVETSAPPSMINSGWTKQTLKPGDQVTVTVNPVKSGRTVGRVVEVVLPNGKKLSGGFGSQPPAAGNPGGENAGAAAGSADGSKSGNYPK